MKALSFLSAVAIAVGYTVLIVWAILLMAGHIHPSEHAGVGFGAVIALTLVARQTNAISTGTLILRERARIAAEMQRQQLAQAGIKAVVTPDGLTHLTPGAKRA